MFQTLLFEALQFNNQNQKPNTIDEKYLQLSEKYNNLQDKYNRFCIKSAVIKPIDLHVEETIKETNEEETNNNSSGEEEEGQGQICTLHGFHDLYSHALNLAKQNAEEAAKLLSSITMLETFPGFSEIYDLDTIISEKKKVIDNWNLFPYLSYLQKTKNNLINVSRKHLQDQVTSKDRKTVKTISYITFSPNKWFQDFLYVYENAKRVHKNYYPKYENMENLLYTKNEYYPLTSNANGSMMICDNYALDIPYHLSRFAGLISKINFIPYKTIPMMQDTFTDIEFLLHYALRKDPKEYLNFLQDPKSFFACTELGSKHTLLLKRLHQAVVEILQTWKPTYKFRNTTKGMELVEFISSTKDEENTYRKINVPDIIVKSLSSDILDNIMVYEREREITNYTDQVYSNPNIYKESPLGKFLNFDKASRAEFIKYYKCVNPENPLMVSARFHTKVIGGFSCVTKVYCMLMMGSLCLYNMSDIENEEFDKVALTATLGSCVRYNPDLNVIFYASSLEIFPGLLFYALLGANENTDDLINPTEAPRSSSALYQHHKSGLSSLPYFKNNTQRTDFFNLFAMYVAQLKPLSDSSQTNALPTSLYQQDYDSSKGISNNLGIRWVTRDNLQMLCDSVLEIAECRASYCTILAEKCKVDKGHRLHSDKSLNQYFLYLPRDNGYKHCTATVEKHYQIATFYKLPVVFLYRYIVAEKQKHSSSLQMLLQNMSDKLQEKHQDS